LSEADCCTQRASDEMVSKGPCHLCQRLLSQYRPLTETRRSRAFLLCILAALSTVYFSDHTAPCISFTVVVFFLSRSFLFQIYYGNVVLVNACNPQDRQVSALYHDHSDRRSVTSTRPSPARLFEETSAHVGTERALRLCRLVVDIRQLNIRLRSPILAAQTD